MTHTSIFRLLLIAMLAAGPAAGVFADDDDDDHNLARRLVSEGKIRELAVITEKVATEVPGKVLSVEFENDDGVYKYELKILRPEGKVQEIEVDAVSGVILKIEDDD